jgi:ribulose-phosphate 3-epimerase
VTPQVKIAPSILTADFGRLAEQIQEAEAAGVDLIHLDVMDGHFVPPITFGALVVEAVRRATALPLDIHLMIEQPDRHVDSYIDAGGTSINVHIEACVHIHRTVEQIKARGAKAGVGINPGTAVAALDAILPYVDQVLVMSVNPGWGGQEFIAGSVEKVAAVRRALEERGLRADIEVDGGVSERTAAAVVAAGATVLVAGSAIYNPQERVCAAVARLRQSIRNAQPPKARK